MTRKETIIAAILLIVFGTSMHTILWAISFP